MTNECSQFKNCLKIPPIRACAFNNSPVFPTSNHHIPIPEWLFWVPKDLNMVAKKHLENPFEFSSRSNVEGLWIKLFTYNPSLKFYSVDIPLMEWSLFVGEYLKNLNKMFVIPNYWSVCYRSPNVYYRHIIIISRNDEEFMRHYQRNLIKPGLDSFVEAFLKCTRTDACEFQHVFVAKQTPPTFPLLVETLIENKLDVSRPHTNLLKSLLDAIDPWCRLQVVGEDCLEPFINFGRLRMGLVWNTKMDYLNLPISFLKGV